MICLFDNIFPHLRQVGKLSCKPNPISLNAIFSGVQTEQTKQKKGKQLFFRFSPKTFLRLKFCLKFEVRIKENEN